MRRRSRIALLAAGVAGAAALVVGCGADDSNRAPRPPVPIELSAKIGDDKVLLSPTTVGSKPIGAGLANVTIANFTDRPAALDFSGPTDEHSTPVVAHGTTNYKLNLRPGDYTVRTDDSAIRPMQFTVGPERPSSNNDLLLP